MLPTSDPPFDRATTCVKGHIKWMQLLAQHEARLSTCKHVNLIKNHKTMETRLNQLCVHVWRHWRLQRSCNIQNDDLHMLVKLHTTQGLSQVSKLPVILNSSATPKLSKTAKMPQNGVKWPKMVIFLTESNDNCLFKKMGGRVAS